MEDPEGVSLQLRMYGDYEVQLRVQHRHISMVEVLVIWSKMLLLMVQNEH